MHEARTKGFVLSFDKTTKYSRGHENLVKIYSRGHENFVKIMKNVGSG